MATKKESSYAELKSELDAVLAALQSDDLSVDDGIKAYQRGMELVKQLETLLKEAENKVTKLKMKFDT